MIFGINTTSDIVSNFTRLTAREITCNNFGISLVVFMPNITTNHAITYTNLLILFYFMQPRSQGPLLLVPAGKEAASNAHRGTG